MKTLLILRHGKSSWDEPVADHDRPLTRRGKEAALRMGQALRDLQLVPDLILTSTARRARKTAKRVKRASGYSGRVLKRDELYDAGADRHLEVLSALDDSCRRALLVGHNPALEDLVEKLTGEEVVLPTAALACIDLDCASWSGVGTAAGRLCWVRGPRELTGEVVELTGGERGGARPNGPAGDRRLRS